VGLRTGGRRAKGLKNRVKSSKIELRFREVRLEGSSPRAAVLQALSFLSIFASASRTASAVRVLLFFGTVQALAA